VTAVKKPRVVKQDTSAEEKPTAVEKKTEAPEKELGIHVSLLGPVKDEEGDYMDPRDLARYELFRAKRQIAASKRVIVEKEAYNLRLQLKWQEQSLRIAKLEYDAKERELADLQKELEKDLTKATKEFEAIGQEVQEKYNLTPENLIYDDISGKLMSIDD